MRAAERKTLRGLLDAGSPDKLQSLISAVDRVDNASLHLETQGQVHFLRNFTIELIEPFLKYRLYQSEILPLVSFGGYDTVYQELLGGHSVQSAEPPDVTVVSLMLENLDARYGLPGWKADTVQSKLEELFKLAAGQSASMIAVNTFLPPFYREQGVAILRDLTDTDREVRRVNDFIRQHVADNPTRFVLMDWERFVRILGEDRSIDYRYWYMSQAPFKSAFLDLYATEIARVVRAIKGKSKKCVVLDCDNTLWGGIVGEDGLHGIKLDPNEWPGRAYYDFQKTLLCLAERGILLTLCSKNNEADVWQVLDEHPHSLLKREHLAAWRINWDNKAENIVSLADELNLGLDSFVFVEDDAAQCELIGQTLPDVTVIQVPQHLYQYPGILSRNPLFDTLAISGEDRRRTALYHEQRAREAEKQSFGNIDDYLASLGMQATIRKAAEHEIPRVAQLTQKTNQFNLTTRRYSEAEITALSKHADTAIYTLSVRDRFGDSGLTGVLIAKRQGDEAHIDTLLLSCRILGRDLEYLFTDFCLSRLEKEWGISRWTAEYIPSRKNAQTSEFWNTLGFIPVGESAAGKSYTVSTEDRQHYDKELIELITE